jgi:GNAT superfamily N-acetyltransferase
MPPLALVIRDARASDRDALVEGNALLAQETENKTLDPAVLQVGVEAAIAEPDRLRYWIAESNGRAVGHAAITREWSDWRNGWIWWLQSVYVWPEYRSQGVFRALYAHIRTLAANDPGVIGIRLYVDDSNHAAERVYQSLGLKPGGYHVLEELWIGARPRSESV